MIITPLPCPACGETHSARGGGWDHAELARQRWSQHGAVLPVQVLGHLRHEPDAYTFGVYDGDETRRRQTTQFRGTWDDYHAWLAQESYAVREKGARFVTNPSSSPSRRREHNQLWSDRIFLDCDNAGPPDKLVAFFSYYGVAAIFHESAGSVKRRTEAWQAGQPDPGVTSWHCEIPLSQRICNPYSTPDKSPPSDPRWSHWRSESKRAHAHYLGVLGAFAGFPGVGQGPNGHHCGFDLAPNQLCSPRFLGCRHHPQGPLPWIYRVPGNNAVDLEALLYSTGFEPKPYIPPQPIQAKKIRLALPGGRTREKTVVSNNQQLYADVKERLDCHTFLQVHLGRQPTKHTNSSDAYYYCPGHLEELNPSNLPGGPNKQGFHAFTNSQGESRFRCHGDCGTGGDVIHLAALAYGVTVGKAAWKLAELIGLDLDQYRSRVEQPELEPVAELVDGPEEEPDEDLADLPQPPPSVKRRAPTRHTPLSRTTDWIETHLDGVSKLGNAVRAMVRFAVEGDARERKELIEAARERNELAQIPMEEDPDRLAASVYTVLHDQIEEDRVEGEAWDVCDRLQRGKRAAGRDYLKETLGPLPLMRLSMALYQDARAEGRLGDRTFTDFFRKATMFQTASREDRRFLHGVFNDFFKARMEQAEVEKAVLDSQEDADPNLVKAATDKYYLERYLALQSRRPTACKRFHHKVSTTFGREVCKKQMLVCQGKLCLYCLTLETLYEYELLLSKWKEHEDEGGRFHLLRCVADTWEQIHDLKKAVSRCNRPRLAVLGVVDDDLRSGRPAVTFVCKKSLDLGYVRSSARAWYGQKIIHEKQVQLDNCERRWAVDTAEEALAEVLSQKAYYRLQGLQQIWAKDPQGLEDYLTQTFRKQAVVSRNPKGLPWVTKAEMAEEAKRRKEDDDELDLAEGEELVYELVHTKTGVVIAKQVGRPFQIDQAAALAALKREIRDTMRAQAGERKKKRTRSRARAPT